MKVSCGALELPGSMQGASVMATYRGCDIHQKKLSGASLENGDGDQEQVRTARKSVPIKHIDTRMVQESASSHLLTALRSARAWLAAMNCVRAKICLSTTLIAAAHRCRSLSLELGCRCCLLLLAPEAVARSCSMLVG
eukprot:1159841-Pelagomonas_calceolata.AAC.12